MSRCSSKRGKALEWLLYRLIGITVALVVIVALMRFAVVYLPQLVMVALLLLVLWLPWRRTRSRR